MSREVTGDSIATNDSKILDALNSRYTCIHEPLVSSSDYSTPSYNRRYLTSLKVFVNREVDQPQSPTSTSSSNATVDQNITDPQIIKEKVTAALKVLSFRESRVLVQFWSPVAIRKRSLLTTLDQPFGLGVVDEGLYLYRLESEQRVFVVDGEHREELGPPGRVYRQKLPEWSLDVRGLSTRQSVQDWAACYNIHGYVDLPVFEPRSGTCVGVLEVLTSSKYVDYAFEVRQISRALKEENLKSLNVLEDTSLYTHVGCEKRQLELDEIFCAIKTVCDIHNLPLAQTWRPCGYSSVVANSRNLEKSCSSFSRNCIGKVCMSTASLPFYVRDLSTWGFREACRERHLDKSQGVVGRSLSSHGLCFCKDVSKLGEDEYPLASYTRMHGITSCLAIYLESLEVDDGEYVVELFLPTHSEDEADLQSLVKTVKQHIKNASRIQLGSISSPQIIGGIPLNLNLESPTLTEKGESPQKLENLHEKNDCDVEDVRTEDDFNSEKWREKHIDYSKEPVRKKKTDRPISLEDEKPSSSAAASVETNQNVIVPYKDVGIEDVEMMNTGKGREINIDYSKKLVIKRKKTDRSISIEEISEHYGKTMEEAAESLYMSRSTLKRICRSHGVPRWPHIRTTNESDPLMKPDQTDAPIHASDGALTTLVLGTSNATNKTRDPATLSEHNKEPKKLSARRAKPEATIKDKHIDNIAANMFTMKVTYQEDTVKFAFRLSDGLEKLEKLVATRFQLSHGTFSLKYEDDDGDMILIGCDNDLIASLGVFRRQDAQTAIRLSVWPVTHQNQDD